MHPNSTKPKFKKAEFIQNNTRPNIYDLEPGSELDIFDYVLLTKTKAQHIKSNGAPDILEGYKNSEKVLYTGLIPHPTKKALFGDHLNANTGKKSFLVVKISEQKITMLYFKNKFVSVPAAAKFIDMYVCK